MEIIEIIISPIVSALLAAFAAYTATKRAADERMRKQEEATARLEEKVDALKHEVEKHNQVIERTYKLEADVQNLFHRYSEIKIGGTQ